MTMWWCGGLQGSKRAWGGSIVGLASTLQLLADLLLYFGVLAYTLIDADALTLVEIAVVGELGADALGVA